MILDGSPRAFNRNLLVLTRWKSNIRLREFNFEIVDCWLQSHDIPLDYNTEATTKELSASIGIFRELDKKEILGKYMRIKVGLNIEQPLRPFITLVWDQMQDAEVRVAYEKIPKLCYYCGYLGHELKDCYNHFNDKNRGLKVDIIQERRGFSELMKA